MSYDRFEIKALFNIYVSIPLEQGSVLRLNWLFFFSIICLLFQSLWNRAVSYDLKLIRRSFSIYCFNPFGTGQCLTTAVGSSSLVRQGLPKPLPNFFRDSESWVLIWLNVEQILTFHLHIKRSKTRSILPEF